MSKSNLFEAEILAHIFQNANIPNIGDAVGLRGSTVAGSLYVVFCTADPGEAGTALTNEIAYTGYARQAVPRSAAGFTITGSSVSPTNNVDFPEMTGGVGGTVTFFSIVKELTGASVILYSGAVSPSIAVAASVTPRLKSSSTIQED